METTAGSVTSSCKLHPWKRIVLVLFTLIVCVSCDQKTKALASHELQSGATKSFLHDTVRMVYTENPGGFLGLGSSLPTRSRAAILVVGCSAGTIALCLYLLFASRSARFEIFALALACAGGVGNLIDRWAYGHVRDFLNIGIGPLRTGIFNGADVALMCGCFLFLWVHWSERRARPSPRN